MKIEIDREREFSVRLESDRHGDTFFIEKRFFGKISLDLQQVELLIEALGELRDEARRTRLKQTLSDGRILEYRDNAVVLTDGENSQQINPAMLGELVEAMQAIQKAI